MNRLSFLAVVTVLSSPGWLIASEMVPFVIPADINRASGIAKEYKPLAEQDRLHAGEHFLTDNGQRIRLWGVNLSFEANFPTHQDAERIAERMAVFGVNAVRCHHMDTAPWPRGILAPDGKDLHPEALDRLDYFIDQLAKHGIYTDMNLHVGRKHSATLGLPETPTDYDKMVNIFTPELIQAQKEYARMLLTHKNPYRGNVAYAEDYAVAIVEITNENSLFMWGAENTLRSLPSFYADILKKQYNGWLSKKYGTTEKLKEVWNEGIEPLGNNLLTAVNTGTSPWFLEQHEEAKARLADFPDEKQKDAVAIEIQNSDGTDWHLQYNYRQLKIRQGGYYTIRFRAKSQKPRDITVSVLQAHEPWENLGLYHQVYLTTEWREFTLGFTATQSDDNARLNFAFGKETGDIYLADVFMASGGQVGLFEGESLENGNVTVMADREIRNRQIDRMVFLAETEKAYFDGMRQFIKNDLNCRAMVTGTIVFGPLGLYAQSDMDFIDSHAYWQHPRFPNRSWDAGDWLIEQKAMSDNPPGTLYELAAERLAGKPFTVSEYNHPAPLDSQAECVPMIASFAAAQDWDGVWLYTYSHSNDQFGREHMNSYFDIDTNPAKWGFMPAGAVMFRDMKLLPFGQIYRGSPSSSQKDPVQMEARARIHLEVERNMLKTIGPTMRKLMMQRDITPPDTSMTWNASLYFVANENALTITGSTERFDEVNRGKIQILTPAFAAITIVSLDGKPLESSVKILITACGRCENTGMQFSQDRSTVGRNWGTAPVMIEPVEGTITLPASGGQKMSCKALNPNGTVREQIAVENGVVELKAEYGTMWYLVER